MNTHKPLSWQKGGSEWSRRVNAFERCLACDYELAPWTPFPRNLISLLLVRLSSSGHRPTNFGSANTRPFASRTPLSIMDIISYIICATRRLCTHIYKLITKDIKPRLLLIFPNYVSTSTSTSSKTSTSLRRKPSSVLAYSLLVHSCSRRALLSTVGP